ncbi:MAG: hypothetical protein M3332_10090 [Actinomycetota bacterium]|nr:hypothetical protein [Actinomycetota bacterium]
MAGWQFVLDAVPDRELTWLVALPGGQEDTAEDDRHHARSRRRRRSESARGPGSSSVAGDSIRAVAGSGGPVSPVRWSAVEHLLGDYTAFGDVLATLIGVDPEDDSWDDAVRSAFGLDDIRDVEVKYGYATDQLEKTSMKITG